MNDFITVAYVGKQSVVRDLITGTEYPFKTGSDSTTMSEAQRAAVGRTPTRAEAEAAATTAQRTLIAAMKASGDLAASVTDLQGIQAAYAVYSA